MNEVLHLRSDVVNNIAVSFVHQLVCFSHFLLQLRETFSKVAYLLVELRCILPRLCYVGSFLQLGRSGILAATSRFGAVIFSLIMAMGFGALIVAFTVLSSLIIGLLIIVEDLSFVFKVVLSLASLSSRFGVILSKDKDYVSWLYLIISGWVSDNILDLSKVLLLVLTGNVRPAIRRLVKIP
jgi:hypothetical protein